VPLRDEDYVAFVDESTRPDPLNPLTVVSGVLIPSRWLRPAERRWEQFIRSEVGRESGIAEFKAHDLLAGKGLAIDIAKHQREEKGFHKSAKGAAHDFYKLALEHIALIAEARVLAVGSKTLVPEETYRLWYWLLYATLVQRADHPRPRISMIIIDGQDRGFRRAQDLIAYRFYRRFPNVQPYVAAGNEWFIGGSALHESHLHPFIQFADLICGVARRNLEGNPKFASWYPVHIRDYASARGREVDCSPAALACLERLDPAGATGWKDALLVA